MTKLKNRKQIFDYINSIVNQLNIANESHISFRAMHQIKKDMEKLERNSFRAFLDHIACMGLKPVFDKDNFILLGLDQSNMINLPTEFSFNDDTPFSTATFSTTGNEFYPLMNVSEDIYVHKLRWFHHPKKQGINVPIVFDTLPLSQFHSNKGYVYLPILSVDDVNLQFIRVSMIVFSQIRTAWEKSGDHYMKLDRSHDKGKIFTKAITTKNCGDFVLHRAQQIYETEYPQFAQEVEQYRSTLPEYRETIMDVADYILHLN